MWTHDPTAVVTKGRMFRLLKAAQRGTGEDKRSGAVGTGPSPPRATSTRHPELDRHRPIQYVPLHVGETSQTVERVQTTPALSQTTPQSSPTLDTPARHLGQDSLAIA
jgi:hypothetical protein